MNQRNLTKKQLMERINELEMLNQALLNEKDQEVGLDYPWTGNLGHWYWNIKTNTVTFNQLKATALGYTKEELPEHVSYQFFTEKLHPEDYQMTMDAMLDHLYGRKPIYEVEYRIQTKEGGYKWYYDRGKITQFDEEGKPLFLAGIVFDITKNKDQQKELEEKNKILEELASIDGLTKIKNHKALLDHLDSQIDHHYEQSKDLSIALFDIDDFKYVNDNKGHVVGDCILYEIAATIQNGIRGIDYVGRYGGEEFLVIMPNTHIEEASDIAERIRKNVENQNFSYDVKVTISGGVKQFRGESLTEFIDAADKLLYQAKKGGKNQVICLR